jgi:hypothetical protein
MVMRFFGIVGDGSGQLEDQLFRYAQRSGLNIHSPYDLDRLFDWKNIHNEFHARGTWDGARRWIDQGRPLIFHGWFTRAGHIVVISGYDSDRREWIVDDPYGRYTPNGYDTRASGSNVRYSYDLLERLSGRANDGQCWLHFCGPRKDTPQAPILGWTVIQDLGNSAGLTVRAVGYSEGNLTLRGDRTANYYGHTDPGNARRNIGAFSYQHHRGNITPVQADKLWLTELETRLLPRYTQRAIGLRIEPNNQLLWALYADLYTQAPAAVLLAGGLLDQMGRLNVNLTLDHIVNCRVQAFYTPEGRLDAPGFGNDRVRLERDQRRRTQAIIEAVNAYGQ